MKPSATIIGGSMAGLFAATALSKNGWEISIHEKVPVPLSGRGAGIATYDELADLVFKATNNNDVLGTTAKLRVSLDNDGNINGSYNYPQVYTSWQYLFSILREQISNENYYMGDDCIKIDQNNHVLATIASLSSEVGVFSNVRQNGQNYYHIHRGQNGTTFKEINSQIGAISANVWNHVAIVNQVGQDLKLYLNGQSISDQGSSFTTVATPSTSNPRSPLHIGASSGQTGGSTGPMNGQIQDFRISKRVVYTNNFAPPTSLLDDSCATLPEVSSFSGWNYSTTFTSPASNAGGSNNKTFWNNSAYNGRGYYHPSSTNKLKMFDGDPSTYAGDYLIKEYHNYLFLYFVVFQEILEVLKLLYLNTGN